MENKYPIGGYAPGNYHCKCCTCGNMFNGDKRAVQCEPCAVSAKERFDKLDPNDQELLIKRNAMIANYMFSGPLTPERELIYRIVEQWGNAIEMPNMEGWLKEYAAQQAPTGAVWVKASERLPEHNVGVLVFIPGEDNHITSGMWDISNEWVLLDEYRTPHEEVTHWTALPAFPEGYTNDDIPEEWVSTLKAIAKEELAKKGITKADAWISVNDQLPIESGRYWCYVEHQADLGLSHFQWNCDYNAQLKRFSDMTLKDGEQVTHWRELPAGPKK